MRKALAAISLAGIAGTLIIATPREAAAQTTDPVTPTGKGITGCALLGAETVALIQAAAGVRARWPYAVFPALGAVAGGVGGYFLEDAGAGGTDTLMTGIAVGTLVLGAGLVIPTVIAYVNATAYRPENDQPSDDNAPSNAPIDEGTQPEAGGTAPAGGTSGGTTTTPETAPSTTPTPTTTPSGGASGGASGGGTNGTLSHVRQGGSGRRVSTFSTLRPRGLLDLGEGGPSLQVPWISVENSVSARDMRQYGIAPMAEFRLPVLSGTF